MKEVKDTKADESGELPHVLERLKKYLRLQTARLSVKARLLILVAFCSSLFGYCLYLILRAFH